MRHGSSALRLIALLVAVVATAAAQQEPKPRDLPDAPVAKQESTPQKRQNPFNTTIEVLGRRSIFFPDIATSVGPLSSKQKFELFADESVAPSRFLSSAFGAGIGQAQNSLDGYGQEMGGYGKRFGSSMATAASNNFFGTFLISSLLHRDPRYFVTLHGGAGHRIGYALSRIVVARTDDGKDAANWAGMLGPLLAESLANSYLPVKEQTAGRTFQRYGIRIGLNTASNALREYWPTIFRNLRITKIAPGLKSNPAATAPGATRPSP
ncbi:MAG TPA: hypothetical protein VGR03_08260 [Candidatus Acidoferrum sp.]|nr:hypothetical protein [Candidatus Acidoferrum sp.]